MGCSLLLWDLVAIGTSRFVSRYGVTKIDEPHQRQCDWSQVLFSDEFRSNLEHIIRRVLLWRKKRTIKNFPILFVKGHIADEEGWNQHNCTDRPPSYSEWKFDGPNGCRRRTEATHTTYFINWRVLSINTWKFEIMYSSSCGEHTIQNQLSGTIKKEIISQQIGIVAVIQVFYYHSLWKSTAVLYEY